MKRCITCKNGILKQEKITFTAERDNVIVVIKSVPALVCDTCEEEYMDETVTREVLNQVDQMVKTGVNIAVKEYIAA